MTSSGPWKRQRQVRVLKVQTFDFPGGPVVKNPPTNAGDMGSMPGPGRFHTPQGNYCRGPQLPSPQTTTTDAHVPRGARILQQEKPPQGEAQAPKPEEPLLTAITESPCAAAKTQHRQNRLL